MTKNITLHEYVAVKKNFLELHNPNPQQCLDFLRECKSVLLLHHHIRTYIPKKHRAFCRTQLKLEGLL